MKISLTQLVSCLALVSLPIINLAQPLDLALFNGANGTSAEPPGWDTVYTHGCLSYLPLAKRGPELGEHLDRWIRLPDQQVDTTNHYDPLRNGQHTRKFYEGTQAIFTPPDANGDTRFWFATNGIHTWDSTMRRVTRYPPAPLHAIAPPSPMDSEGTQGHQRSLMLPVRDTPGVFRHIIAGYRDRTNLRSSGIIGSSDRLYNYRVDANYDASLPEPQNGDAGPGPHLRYSPDPIDPQAYMRAVAWEGDELPYDTSRVAAIHGELPTLSRMIAIAHGNGRDWWIFALGGQSAPRAVALFLLANGELSLQSTNPEGIPFNPAWHHYFHSGMNLEISHKADNIALHAISETEAQSSVFSDYTRGGIALWDFDRCTGDISEATYVDVQYRLTGLDTLQFDRDPEIDGGNGIAFSPSDRYLYYSERSYLARYDLEAVDLLASEELVWMPDSLVSICYGPGYYVSFSNLLRLTTTHTPDPIMLSYGGGSCRLVPAFDNLDAPNVEDINGGWDAFGTPCLNGNAFVSTRYQIYDLSDSPCDTLGIDGPTEGWYDPDYVVSTTEESSTPQSAGILRVYPSPTAIGANYFVDLPSPHASGHIAVFDQAGRRILHQPVSGSQRTVALSATSLRSGLYVISFTSRKGLWTGRLLVVD